MKYWGLMVAVLYALILVVVLMPVMIWILPSAQAGITWGQDLLERAKSMFFSQDSAPVWIYLGAMLLAQAALLLVPVNMAEKRPVTKRTVIPLIIAASLMMGLLAAGVAFAINETARKGNSAPVISLMILGVFLLMWGFWASTFFRWSKKMEPKGFIERQCKYLFRGSILELLIVVPAHILARQRDYCCAGAQTFMGIAFGISVMLFSFGPGIFFLYAERWKHLRKAA
jgi:hypothetical protein